MSGKALCVVISFALAVLGVVAVAPAATAAPGRIPVVLFPAFRLTKLQVTVHGQATHPACPRSGSFVDYYGNDHPSTAFSQVCQDELLTLRYSGDPFVPMTERFSEQPGVDVRVLDYGKTTSAPFYEPLYRTLDAHGYQRDRDIRVAGYDARRTPDLGGFVERTIDLIEQNSRANGNHPVRLVGHSNGPLYAQYLLTHTSRAWCARYIQGFTSIAGNLRGQRLLYATVFTGLNILDFTNPTTPANARSSAGMYLTAPTT
ncbi:hypothetical protein [Amycolatopsis sp. FDAARGOS 1241]|uniref:lipase/acyltransferase domain-containing protein n=1 Tax=Amycolatopsis sp. FDAARGOS 1241 TaxID=2778070 RepID=UPI00194E9B08|nr:hypothetical protein [Amycolatopsis sp. FDAARGOS 1241]QRP47745.1 hypothetical protein I6J71_07430 [Amycolatopsis sp. FDAARGOS 1241]